MITDNKRTVAEKKLIANRQEWETKYSHWLKRKNNFAAKLQKGGRPTTSSKRYTELDAEVKKYWQLLRDSLPEYRAMFNQVGK